MKWARCKWVENNGKIIDDTIPAAWVDVKKKTVYWPNKECNKALGNHTLPQPSWLKFRLIKKKLEHDDEDVCERYDFTTDDIHSDSSDVNDLEVDENSNAQDDIESPVPPPSPPPMMKSNTGKSTSEKASKTERLLSRSSISDSACASPSSSTTPLIQTSSTPTSFMCSFKETWGKRVSKSIAGLKRKNNQIFDEGDDDVSFSTDDSSKNLNSSSQKRKVQNLQNNVECFSESDTQKLLLEILKYAKKSFRLSVETRNMLLEQNSLSVNNGQTLFKRAETIEDFDEIEEGLNDVEKRKEAVTYLRGIGGSDFNDHTKSAMKRLMTDNVMALMNMHGGGNKSKIGFHDKITCQVVIDSVKARFKDASERDIKGSIQNYLRNAPARKDGKKDK